MARDSQGNKERGTTRNGPAALVRHIHRRTNSRARECACTKFGQEKQRLGPAVVCAGKTSAAQPWRQHKADDMRTTTGQRRVDGKQGSAHDEGLCSHDSWPKKGKALALEYARVWVWWLDQEERALTPQLCKSRVPAAQPRQ
jgi:hypothetical protein